MKSVRVPDATNFAIKPALAIEMVARAIAAAVAVWLGRGRQRVWHGRCRDSLAARRQPAPCCLLFLKHLPRTADPHIALQSGSSQGL